MKSTLIHAARVLIRIQEAGFKPASDHAGRVAGYALMLARRLGMSVKAQERIYLAGLVHDIGKIGVSSDCLMKHGPLTAAEWEEVKKHPRLSHEIVSAIPGMKEIGGIVLYHHERYDGRGYPEGLSGEKIPPGARLIAIADSFDAMTASRVYRPAVTGQEAVQEMRRCSGTQFDPRLVETFCRLVEQGEIGADKTMDITVEGFLSGGRR
ncbi:HD-GYP domain-containing protein [Desulfotomaculum copahuensis]|uniref:Phosphohydrolase n=1 Tax=Desulfotomaculum copahuensis TaxID=1838280 RepID=A0A1B7LBM0_9FIRM|nr:HD-GYP domain-containing protein [Desulfotomaculum copahuensis]OAT79936.1 phosphohydrolase [Desulfotomaculum copahuensis]